MLVRGNRSENPWCLERRCGGWTGIAALQPADDAFVQKNVMKSTRIARTDELIVQVVDERYFYSQTVLLQFTFRFSLYYIYLYIFIYSHRFIDIID